MDAILKPVAVNSSLKKAKLMIKSLIEKNGAWIQDRTGDILITNQVLYQLSYPGLLPFYPISPRVGRAPWPASGRPRPDSSALCCNQEQSNPPSSKCEPKARTQSNKLTSIFRSEAFGYRCSGEKLNFQKSTSNISSSWSTLITMLTGTPSSSMYSACAITFPK